MRNKRKNQGHIVDLFFTLPLFCLFAASALIVVIIGSDVYRKTTANMEENYATRTALSYTAEKIRQHDSAGGIYLTDDDDGNTILVLSDNAGGETYLTYIYAYDGWLCELVVKEGTGFSKEQGEQILEVDTFSVEEEDGFIRVTAADSGSAPVSCLLHLRSGSASSIES